MVAPPTDAPVTTQPTSPNTAPTKTPSNALNATNLAKLGGSSDSNQDANASQAGVKQTPAKSAHAVDNGRLNLSDVCRTRLTFVDPPRSSKRDGLRKR